MGICVINQCLDNAEAIRSKSQYSVACQVVLEPCQPRSWSTLGRTGKAATLGTWASFLVDRGEYR